LQSINLRDGYGAQIETREITNGVFIVNYMGTSQNLIYVDQENTAY